MKTEPGRKCRQFYCDHRGDRWCCKDFPDPCGNACLNHPDKCRLVETEEPPKPPEPRRKRGIDENRALELWEQGMTDADIGEIMGLHKMTIYNWRHRVGLGRSKKRPEDQ